MKILTTTDYDQFKTVKGNRAIDMNHVNHLVEINSKEHLLNQFPATITKDNYLWDGQHRLAACKANNWEFPYTVSDKTLAQLNDDIVAITNIAQKRWGVPNFIDFHAAHEKEQYIFLQYLMKEYRLPHSIIMKLVAGKEQSVAIKLGKLSLFITPDDKTYIEDVIKQYVELRGVVPAALIMHGSFAGAIRTIFKDYTAKDLQIAIERTPIQIVVQRGIKDYLRMFEEIINYRKQEKNYIRFF